MGIKKIENQILSKAKVDQKKVEQNKRKFREGMSGGQITNQLRNLSEANIKYKIQELNIRLDEAKKDKDKKKEEEEKP